MSFTPQEKILTSSYLLKEDEYFLLKEDGYRIIILGTEWSNESKPSTSFSKIAK